MKKYYVLFAIVLLAAFASASDYLVDENMNMRENQIYNATWVNSTNLNGNLQSEDVKSPPSAPAVGYAVSHFVNNFSTVIVDYFNINSDKWLGDFDAMDYSLGNLSTLNVTTINVTENITSTGYYTGHTLWSQIVGRFITAVDDVYIYMSGTTATLNETKLNETIDLRVVIGNDSMKLYVDAQDIAFNTSMTNYADTKLPLTGGAMTGNTTHGDNIMNKYGSSNDACIYYNGSALIISSVAGDCA